VLVCRPRHTLGSSPGGAPIFMFPPLPSGACEPYPAAPGTLRAGAGQETAPAAHPQACLKCRTRHRVVTRLSEIAFSGHAATHRPQP
jgi:hypothetical protein